MSCARKNTEKITSGVKYPAIASVPESSKRWPIPSHSIIVECTSSSDGVILYGSVIMTGSHFQVNAPGIWKAPSTVAS